MLKRNRPRLHDVACKSTDQIMPGITGLLPHGLAWDAGRQPGSTMWRYFRSWASFLTLFEARLCQLSREMFCREAQETANQWNLDYDVPGDCVAFDACVKKTWVGGGDCAYFVDLLDQHGWTVSKCESLSNDDVAFANCAYAGCAFTGPTATVLPNGSNLGAPLGELDQHDSGGWHREHMGPEAQPMPYVGLAHHWVVEIDLSLSPAWTSQVVDAEASAAGCAYAGCATACSPDPSGALCLLELVRPAHTVVVPKFINA
jgi:hypothetical protein